jgi:hypothetical protein
VAKWYPLPLDCKTCPLFVLRSGLIPKSACLCQVSFPLFMESARRSKCHLKWAMDNGQGRVSGAWVGVAPALFRLHAVFREKRCDGGRELLSPAWVRAS